MAMVITTTTTTTKEAAVLNCTRFRNFVGKVKTKKAKINDFAGIVKTNGAEVSVLKPKFVFTSFMLFFAVFMLFLSLISFHFVRQSENKNSQEFTSFHKNSRVFTLAAKSKFGIHKISPGTAFGAIELHVRTRNAIRLSVPFA